MNVRNLPTPTCRDARPVRPKPHDTLKMEDYVSDAPVVRPYNKHNLFGLTNPRTGKYFEFGHWTESVQAYYTKVQYKYKGGNYLLWLRDIGYAENPNYIREVIGVLRTWVIADTHKRNCKKQSLWRQTYQKKH